MFRDVILSDKEIFLTMAETFYSSSAVLHCIDRKNFEAAFALAINKSPFVRLLMIESDENDENDEKIPIGYAQISFTYSMEAGGMVALVEDVYIDPANRGGGYGGKLLGFLEKEYPDFKRFRLEVMGNNEKAIGLFEKCGYKLLDYRQMVKDF